MPMSDKKEKTKANVSGFHTRNFLSQMLLYFSHFYCMGSRRRKKLGMAQRILIFLLSVQLVENRVRGKEERKRSEFGNFTDGVKDNIGTSM